MIYTRAILLVLASLSLSSASFGETKISVKNAWVRALPAGAKITAAFMEIQNKTAKDLEIVKATSSSFGLIELHQTVKHGDMMKMKKQKSFKIKAGQTLVLKPKSFHLMLFKPSQKFQKGQKIDFEFQTSDKKIVKFQAEVKAQKDDSKHSHHHHHGGM